MASAGVVQPQNHSPAYRTNFGERTAPLEGLPRAAKRLEKPGGVGPSSPLPRNHTGPG